MSVADALSDPAGAGLTNSNGIGGASTLVWPSDIAAAAAAGSGWSKVAVVIPARSSTSRCT